MTKFVFCYLLLASLARSCSSGNAKTEPLLQHARHSRNSCRQVAHMWGDLSRSSPPKMAALFLYQQNGVLQQL